MAHQIQGMAQGQRCGQGSDSHWDLMAGLGVYVVSVRERVVVVVGGGLRGGVSQDVVLDHAVDWTSPYLLLLLLLALMVVQLAGQQDVVVVRVVRGAVVVIDAIRVVVIVVVVVVEAGHSEPCALRGRGS